MPFDEQERSTVGVETDVCAIDRRDVQCWRVCEPGSEFCSATSQAVVDDLKKQEAAAPKPTTSSQADRPTRAVEDASTSSKPHAAPATTPRPASAEQDGARARQLARQKKRDEEAVRLMDGEMLAKYYHDGTDRVLRLSIWDFGGQRVFYALHHMYLTRYGVYLVCFRLTDMVDGESARTSEAIEFLRFWLNSIKMHADGAPIILVGTHKDMISDDEDHRRIDELLADRLGLDDNKNIKYCEHARLCFFAVDNTVRPEDKSVCRLREAIEKAVMDDVKGYIHEELPLIWLAALDELCKSKAPYIELEAAVETSEQCGVPGRESVLAMLRLFHELGVMLHFEVDELHRLVVIEPQWLVTTIAKLIRDPDKHRCHLHFFPFFASFFLPAGECMPISRSHARGTLTLICAVRSRLMHARLDSARITSGWWRRRS